jgi:integrase
LAVVELGGQQHFFGPWQSEVSFQNYGRLLAAWQSSSSASTLTVKQLIDRYLEHARDYYGDADDPRGCYARLQPVVRLLAEAHGDEPAKDFGPLKLKALRDRMIGRGNARSYINANVGRIKQLFRWAASEELVGPDVSRALDTIEGLRKGRSRAREGRKVRPVATEHVLAVLPHLGDVVADMVRLQLLLGCRSGELCIMRPCDVDCGGEVWAYRPAHHKTEHHGKDRAIYIGPRAQEILRRYLERPAGDYCFSPAESEQRRLAKRHEARRTPMSCGNRPGSRGNKPRRYPAGQRYTNDSLRRAIQRGCKKAGVPLWHPHQLRHARATEIRRELGLEAAQVCLGHSQLAVTELYAEKNERLAATVAKQMG